MSDLIEQLENYTQTTTGTMQSDPKHLMNLAAKEIERLNECSFQYRDDVRLLEEENTRMKGWIAVSGGLKCPACDDVGWYVDVSGEQQVQCEFCYTVDDSIFNRKMNAEAGT